MKVLVNLTLLTNDALIDVGKKVAVEAVNDKPWLFGIKLKGGKTVAAYPISVLNPSAPPSFYIDDPKCREGVHNRDSASKITKELSKYTKSKSLKAAVIMLKEAVEVISR